MAVRRGRISSPRETNVTVTLKRRTLSVAAVAFVVVGVSGFALGWIARGPGEAPKEDGGFVAADEAAPAKNKLEEVDALSFHERLIAQHAKRAEERVAAVEEEPPPPPPERASEPAKKRKEPPASARWGVQIGAFQSEAEADAFIEANKSALRGKPVYVLATPIPEKGTWYRVRVGAHAAKREADAARGKLPPELGKNAMVVGYK